MEIMVFSSVSIVLILIIISEIFGLLDLDLNKDGGVRILVRYCWRNWHHLVL